MGHFALVDDQSIVRDVIAVTNAAMNHLPFPDSEPVGQAMLTESGFTGTWVQTSYNAQFRGKFAGIGDLWNGIDFTTPTQDDGP